MNSRERVLSAFNFNKVDMVPIEYHSSLRGYFEHGEDLRKLFKKYPGDFNDVSNEMIPVISDNAYDKNGEYYEEVLNDWGVVMAYRIFMIAGHPIKRPLDDIENNIESFKLPKKRFANQKYLTQLAKDKKKFFCSKGGFTLFEKMSEVRRFEDVLMDMYMDTPEINRLADLITEHFLEEIDNLLKADVDCVWFGDDFGTQEDLIISPKIFRDFLKPRYKVMIDKVKAAGKKVHFHSCGANIKLFDDLADLGIDSLWPQLTAYNVKELASRLREYKIACALHFRGHIMNFGTTDDVRRWVSVTSEAFDVKNGGSWYYLEIDDGFKYENIKTLFETMDELRR